LSDYEDMLLLLSILDNSHLIRSLTRRIEGNSALLLDAHLLLQGDFFLTSRCNPPEWNESGNWERCNLMKKLRLLEKIGIARKSEKRRNSGIFCRD